MLKELNSFSKFIL